jgi:flagellar FliJ protein
MKGAAALIKLANYEVEVLQTRLGSIAERRMAFEMMLCSLEAEAEAEAQQAQMMAEAGFYLAGYREGWKIRKAKTMAALQGCEMEEAGCREALNQAFERLKKYEHVTELSRQAMAKEADRREAAQLDELALRRRVQG